MPIQIWKVFSLKKKKKTQKESKRNYRNHGTSELKNKSL